MPKRKCIFNNDLQKKYPMFEQLDTNDQHIVFCATCNSSFSVAYKGKRDLDQHLLTEKHKKNIKSASSCKKVKDFLISRNSKFDDQVSAAEGALAYHTVVHHFGFRSVDCSHKFLKSILPDSKIAQHISSARTKTEAIVINVLAPLSLNCVLDDIKDTKYLSISTDASNHGVQKIFPILLQYFKIDSGVNIKVVDIQAMKDETSDTISNYLLSTLKKLNISSKCIAMSGDNCNTNFGGCKRAGKNNVFYKLKMNGLSNLIGIGCPAHILHNNIQFGFDGLSLDVDSVVMKIYNHFSIYTVRSEKLKSFCESVQIEYKKLLSHSKTRWLSLFPAVERILQMFEGLKTYFLSMDSPPLVLKNFFENDINEAYLWFFHSLMYFYSEQIGALEREKNSILETLEKIHTVQKVLKERISEKFIPLKVKEIFKKIVANGGNRNEVLNIEQNLVEVYARCLKYLQSWCDSLDEFNCFIWMNFNKVPEWNDIQNSLLYLGEKGVNINENKLFDQFCNLKTFLEQEIKNINFINAPIHEKWVNYFEKMCNLELYSELLMIAQFVFAIPAHNANVERIFSLINSQWTEERNRLKIENVKAILFCKHNFKNMSCTEFYNYILQNPETLNKIRSNDKYNQN
ncbi:uncharacterized protein LOC129946862 [Eupeodes corollae]|uniref:uncharacterized protein LOC129946862 n=1 Tax=Eupeodes corollae TaxID=290404 RepID=UPI00249272C1|nr:uncharacterized protein LOC129946862 [Eupeodes corollae]